MKRKKKRTRDIYYEILLRFKITVFYLNIFIKCQKLSFYAVLLLKISRWGTVIFFFFYEWIIQN